MVDDVKPVNEQQVHSVNATVPLCEGDPTLVVIV